MTDYPQTELRKRLREQRKKDAQPRRIILLIFAVIAVIYVIGCLFYRTHFYIGGTIFGMKLRNHTVLSAKESINDKVDSYELSLTTRDGVETITAADVGLFYDDQGEIDALMEEQNPALWFLMFFISIEDRDIAVALDEALLSDTVSSLSCMQASTMTSPTDAYASYTDGAFVINEETYGNELSEAVVYAVVEELVLSGETEASLDELDCYVAPEIYQDTAELIALCDRLNELISIAITFDFSDRTWVVTGDMIAEWILIGDDLSYELDEDAISDYVYSMAYNTDTFGLSHTFTTTYGNTITLKGGDYGWLMNQSATTTRLMELIEAAETVTVEPEYRYSALHRETDDIGSSYVEVSISAQRMWVYVDGECVVSTSVVTGDVALGRDTPSGGVWAIDARIRDYTLSGQDYDSEVSYWIPFNGNVGIHDATWRTEFGGTIYKKNGSHGCVNTPLSAMKTVYENVKIGYPVIVY